MTGRRPLRTPGLIRALFAQPNIQRAAVQPMQQQWGGPAAVPAGAAPAAEAGAGVVGVGAAGEAQPPPAQAL